MDTEVMMDGKRISLTEFMSSFDKFEVHEVSIEDAEDDIGFNSKDISGDSLAASLIGLKYTEHESTIEWDNSLLIMEIYFPFSSFFIRKTSIEELHRL
jgi:hypothetical protein